MSDFSNNQNGFPQEPGEGSQERQVPPENPQETVNQQGNPDFQGYGQQDSENPQNTQNQQNQQSQQNPRNFTNPNYQSPQGPQGSQGPQDPQNPPNPQDFQNDPRSSHPPHPPQNGNGGNNAGNTPPYYGYGQNAWNPGGQQGYSEYSPQGNYRSGSGYNPSGYRNPYGSSSQQPGRNSQGGWQDPTALNTAETYKWNFEEYDNAKNRQKINKKKGTKIILGLLGTAAALGILCLAGVGAWYMFGGNIAEPPADDGYFESSSSSSSEAAQTDPSSPGLTLTDRPASSSSSAAEGEPLSTPDIAEKVKPSVVGILNYGNGSSIQSIMTPNEGSGIIMSDDGYILTNAHVVENASGLKVVMENGDEYEARIVGADDDTDIAVIKINAENLKYAEFGNSDQLRVGEKVVAIGNPRGLTLAGSVTQGIVSAVNRSLSSSPTDFTYIQTDAAINPGNSGGALVNEYGQVIGINTAKISQVASTVYEGIGFAIPISEAKPIIDDLKAYGRVTGRVKFGIVVQTIDAYTAAMYQIPQGAMIISTEEGSDIAEKGIVAGDIIYAVDGNAIISSTELKNAVFGKKPGDPVTLSIYRRTTGYSDKKFDVTVSLMEDTGEAADNSSSSSQAPTP